MQNYTCDACKAPIIGKPTTIYARQGEGPSRKYELCARCVEARLSGIEFQTVTPRNPCFTTVSNNTSFKRGGYS